MEQRAAGLDAGGCIDGVGHQEDHRADDLHELALGEEAVGEILRDGDRVPGADGEAAQPRRLKNPAEGIADAKANGNPGLPHAGGKHRRRKSHEHPGAHIRRAGRQCRHPCAHLAATQEVVLLAAVLGLGKEIKANAQHEQEIDNEYEQFRIVHGTLPPSFLHEKNSCFHALFSHRTYYTSLHRRFATANCRPGRRNPRCYSGRIAL